MSTFDAIVVGGGLVGTAIAYGLAKRGLATALLDEGDVAHRASRGNFGLVWVQSKGLGAPHYQRWTRGSAEARPGLAADLRDRTDLDAALHQPGGLHICLSDEEMETRADQMARMKQEAGNFGFEYRMLDRDEVAERMPGIGPRVAGGSWTPYDGHASPLHLLRGLHAAFAGLGGTYIPGAAVEEITAAPHDFGITASGQVLRAPRVVLAAGLGNADLAPRFGLHAPVRPERGEVLVTERTAPLLPMPTVTVRQTAEGSVMIGDSKEDAGYDSLSQTPAIMRTMAQRAVLTFPWIAELNLVRAWSALRIMSPDGLPVYEQSARFPGAFVANCHSGVTLAAAHAEHLASMIAAGELPPEMAPFSAERFHVPPRPDARPATITVIVAGQPVPVPEGAAAAAAVLLAEQPPARTTAVSGAPRLPYCMMGVCFDCLAVIDGVPNRQACTVPAADGMRIEPQRGARLARPALPQPILP